MRNTSVLLVVESDMLILILASSLSCCGINSLNMLIFQVDTDDVLILSCIILT